MPIVDIEFVRPAHAALPSAQALADAIGQALGSGPSRTWVRVHTLDPSRYAENESPVADGELPVFVTVMRAQWPQGDALAAEVLRVTQAVAACAKCTAERVHVQYAPPGAGRQAFGGKLVQ